MHMKLRKFGVASNRSSRMYVKEVYSRRGDQKERQEIIDYPSRPNLTVPMPNKNYFSPARWDGAVVAVSRRRMTFPFILRLHNHFLLEEGRTKLGCSLPYILRFPMSNCGHTTPWRMKINAPIVHQ